MAESDLQVAINLLNGPPIYAQTCRDLGFHPHSRQFSRGIAELGRLSRLYVTGVGQAVSSVGWALRAAAREQAARARISAILGLPYDTHPAILAARYAGQQTYDQRRVIQQLSPADHRGEPKPWRRTHGRHRVEPVFDPSDRTDELQFGDWGYP